MGEKTIWVLLLLKYINYHWKNICSVCTKFKTFCPIT